MKKSYKICFTFTKFPLKSLALPLKILALPFPYPSPLEIFGIPFKNEEKHKISEAFSRNEKKKMMEFEFPIPFQKIQLISECILNFKWNFWGYIFYKKMVSFTGDNRKFIKWPISLMPSFVWKEIRGNAGYCIMD